MNWHFIHSHPLMLGMALGAAVSVANAQMPELTLSQAMQEALVRYPAVSTSKAQLAAAMSDVSKAEGARWPVLSIGAASMQQSATASSALSATPQASYTLYAGGAIEAGVDRAKQVLLSAQSKLGITRDDVALQAGEAYLLWSRALEQQALALQNLALLEQIKNDVQTIVEVDKGRMVDLQQAQVRLQSAHLTLAQRKVEVDQMRARLARYVTSSIPPLPSSWDTLTLTMPKSLEEALQAAGDQHPSIRQAHADVAAARAAVTIAQAQTRPRVEVSVARQINPYSLNSSTLSQISANMPVFNGGASQASVRSAVEQLTAAQSALDEQALIVREKISSAWAEWSMSRQRADLSEEQAAFSSTLVESYRAQFRLARRSLLELLNAQNETFGYQSAFIQARFDIRFAELKLLNSLGQLANKINRTPD